MSVLSYLNQVASALVLSSTENESIKKSISTLESRLEYFDFSSDIKVSYIFGSYERGTILPRCYDSGVVMIPKDKINEKLLTKLEFIEFQEDIWFYCVDTLKMSTFDTVCLKKYLEGDLIDKKLLEKLNEIQKAMN